MSRIHNNKVWGLVPAGGRGKRFGGDAPKQLIDIGGKPLLHWTLARLLESGLAGLTVALPESWIATADKRFEPAGEVAWVAGGATRQESVAACLAACPSDVPLVLVHDGARPAVAVTDVKATIEAVGKDEGAILGREVLDTMKRIDGQRVIETIDRGLLLRAETPQVFKCDILAEALARSRLEGFVGTDEASIVERLEGVRINYVTATEPNPKLTRPQDLPLISMLLRRTGEVR